VDLINALYGFGYGEHETKFKIIICTV